MQIDFGKHQGKELSQLPESYVRYLLRDLDTVITSPKLVEELFRLFPNAARRSAEGRLRALESKVNGIDVKVDALTELVRQLLQKLARSS